MFVCLFLFVSLLKNILNFQKIQKVKQNEHFKVTKTSFTLPGAHIKFIRSRQALTQTCFFTGVTRISPGSEWHLFGRLSEGSWLAEVKVVTAVCQHGWGAGTDIFKTEDTLVSFHRWKIRVQGPPENRKLPGESEKEKKNK